MYWNILKKDLRRKVTMNVILFLFIVLATMFVSSSVNNIIAVNNALGNFFEKAKMPDYLVATTDLDGNRNLEEVLEEIPEITSKKVEKIVYFSGNQVKAGGEKTDTQGSVLTYFENRGIEFFDEQNEAVTEVKEGEVLLAVKYMMRNNIKKGDKVELTFGDVTYQFTVAGGVKDALMGSSMMSMERFLVCKADFDRMMKTAKNVQNGEIGYIKGEDVPAIKTAVSKANVNVVFDGTKELIRQTYFMDMVVAIALFILSVCLIFIAFVVLRFTIHFTLEEEYREIGVMKAIGLPDRGIRRLYLVKYFVMALLGALFGLTAGVGFGDILLESSSKTIVMENAYGYKINVLSAVFVVAVVVLYCYRCTGKLKKFSPIDAIRNGSNGERYQKKGLFFLSKGRMKPVYFLTINDIFSNLKRYAVMIVTFTIGLLAVLVVANTMNTLRGDGMVEMLGLKKCDVFIQNEEEILQDIIKEDGQTNAMEHIKQLEREVSGKGMPCEVGLEMIFRFTYEKGEKKYKANTWMGLNQKTTDYSYIEGEAPMMADEIAITPQVAEELDAKIGDTITVTTAEGKRKVMITGLFQTMSNMGEGVRLHPDFAVNFSQVSGGVAYQITFTDSPTNKEIEEWVKLLQEMYPKSEVYNCPDFVDYYIGGIAETIDMVRVIFVAISMVISLLVVVLMERSFIAREKSELALLKALGFGNNTLIWWHTLRIGLVMILSIIIGEILELPVSQITAGQAFRGMGAKSIEFSIIPIEILGIYPGILLAATVAGGFLVAQFIRRISASEAATME